MKILVIAPLPPPITGQSVISEKVTAQLSRFHDVTILNYSKNTLSSGFTSIFRVVEIARIFWEVFKHKNRFDRIYFTISQSYAGVLKDLVIFIILYNELDKLIIHLHGNGLKEYVLKNSAILKSACFFFYARLKHIILLGESFREYFSSVDYGDKIKIVNNYAEHRIMIKDEDCYAKHESEKRKIRIKVLYLSNFNKQKGYDLLLKACRGMEGHDFELNFAGGFESEEERLVFMKAVAGLKNVNYLGVVGGEEKVKLLQESHIFVLPTTYKYEGQPISILEAYASGCCVITTDHAGIRDIFQDSINGYFVKKMDYEDLKLKLTSLINQDLVRMTMARTNISTYKRFFTEEIFSSNMLTIFSEEK